MQESTPTPTEERWIAATADKLKLGAHLPPPTARLEWLGLAVFVLITLAVSVVSVRFTRFEGVAGLWIANGLLAGVLLHVPTRQWAPWLVASFLSQVGARLGVGDPVGQLLALSVINVAEGGLVAAWIRRQVGDLRRTSAIGRLARMALLGALIACLASATAALPILLLRPDVTPLVAWVSWFGAHLLGMVIVGTLTVCVLQPNVRLLGAPGHRLDFALSLGLLLAVGAIVFGQSRFSLLFLCYLPLVLLAFRHGLGGMVMGTLALAAMSGLAAALGLGSFAFLADEAPMLRLFEWQVYIAAGCLLAYSTALAMTQRRQLERRLRASQDQLQTIMDHLPAMVARFDEHGRYVYANPRSRATAPGDPVGKTLRDFRDPAHYEEMRPHLDAVLKGEPQQFETWVASPDGRIELRTQLVPDIAPDGSIQGFFSLSFDITDQKQVERELERLARIDPLTGVANRRQLEERLQNAVRRAMRTKAPLMVLALDLDRFKLINDRLGHAAGDEVLKEFARRVQATVYDVDLVARVGGDEFVVLVQHSPSAEAGERMARNLLEAMRPPFVLESGPIEVATSIGIGLQQPAQSADALLALADRALYEAKGRGRNTYALAT